LVQRFETELFGMIHGGTLAGGTRARGGHTEGCAR